MKKTVLGIKRLEVSTLGLGCMGMSECYGKTDDLESIKMIRLDPYDFSKGDLLSGSFALSSNH